MVLGECSGWLAGLSYSPGSAAGVVNVLERLSWWMQLVGSGVDDIDEDLLARFLAVEGSRDLPCVAVKQWIGTMRRFLTAAGYLSATGVQADPLTPAQTAVADWCSWMREQRGLTEKTIAARCHYAADLLDVLTAADGSMQWWRLDAALINAYVAERGRPYGIVARAHIVGSIRCLLRWALSTDQVAALLDVCDPATALGARDRALVMILVRLGLRAGEVARLRLDDIDWTSGHLRVTGKGREHSLPLPVDVGQALEAWLRLRPPALDRAVFVRLRAPRQMMTTSGISGIIARLSDLARIDRIYAHRLRHTAAMELLAAGGTLTEARELLGHAFIVTTMAYAKVDLASLRELVVPFGQVPR
jgi:integrase